MKKLILAAALFLSLAEIKAQTNTASPGNMQTPSSVSNKFRSDYPNSQANWSMDGNNYRADYMDGNNNRAVTYDRNGNIISRDETVSQGSYPSGISDYYNQNYPNEKYQVWASTDANGEKTYYTKHNSKTTWFDNSGKRKTTHTKTKSSSSTNTKNTGNTNTNSNSNGNSNSR